MTIDIEHYYLAALCAYLGYPIVEVRTDGPQTTFVFEMNDWSLEELQTAYDSPEGQPISSVKHYADQLRRLTALQKKARFSQDGIWVSRNWVTMGKEKDVEVV
jgi:hypothetical protein